MAEETTEPVQEQIKISIFTPIIYVAVLVSIFVTFSVVYRRRALKKLTKVEPIFPENHTATLYEYLKVQYQNPDIPKDQKPHEKVMKAALLRRAVEAIRRSMKLKENEPVYTKLYQDGLVGDEVFQQYQIQTKFQELELKDIVQETESYKKGWVQTFFPVAQEICFNEALRRRLYALDDRAKTLSHMWEHYVAKTEEVNEKEKEVKEVKDVKQTKESKPEEEPKVLAESKPE
ncbi:uncharacterized protein CANTADRAFT_71405 [Suhomyces tanzawaensis NRRL Y-17324]|uniref:Translocation protein sec66 n=1 Tax=Suhomyces tanzawaensis NRRL Y-17324 TaxID=984487 RepID=A0A1E4SBW6_9ASCO|nr:uncharacterized protein CANTADRAFT_71405 [Suhomyces tanzawaensis NRRL Y-17324]ODV77004.1 hypothetical protein CANTADRAFT_71405 [Suhomyces tanzawaensis NRRL Y-17324]